MKSKNPFNEKTKSYQDFKTMSDCKWHCSKCELRSGQAKTWQVWRQEKGIQIGTDENGNYYKIIFCKNCAEKTYHRSIVSVKILSETKMRSGISTTLAKKVKYIYKNEEGVFLRKLSSNQLEVDHKFPQIRWKGDEEKNSLEMNENELKKKFILLSRANNLWKSRQCERCVKTGKRGFFPGIQYWYKGCDVWDEKINKFDKKGCEGCFWYDPYKWRKMLNAIVKSR